MVFIPILANLLCCERIGMYVYGHVNGCMGTIVWLWHDFSFYIWDEGWCHIIQLS